jgi:hypothetical protein
VGDNLITYIHTEYITNDASTSLTSLYVDKRTVWTT